MPQLVPKFAGERLFSLFSTYFSNISRERIQNLPIKLRLQRWLAPAGPVWSGLSTPPPLLFPGYPPVVWGQCSFSSRSTHCTKPAFWTVVLRYLDHNWAFLQVNSIACHSLWRNWSCIVYTVYCILYIVYCILETMHSNPAHQRNDKRFLFAQKY